MPFDIDSLLTFATDKKSRMCLERQRAAVLRINARCAGSITHR